MEVIEGWTPTVIPVPETRMMSGSPYSSNVPFPELRMVKLTFSQGNVISAILIRITIK